MLYEVDEFFFEKEIEESFYWAGFIAADGCIVSNKNYKSKILELELCEKDLQHLLLFKSDIKSGHPIKEKMTKNSHKNINWNDKISYRIRIGNYNLCSSLMKYNIVSKKTKIYNMPDWLISHSLVRHFVRGYFDGDGCISKHSAPNRKDDYKLAIAGNKDFLNNVANIICKNVNIPNRSIGFNGNMNVLCYSGNLLVQKIGLYLYDDASIFLKRKYDLWQKCINL
jgi:intein/homing endonuclease